VLKQGYLVKIKGAKNTKALEWIINQFLVASPLQVAVLTRATGTGGTRARSPSCRPIPNTPPASVGGGLR